MSKLKKALERICAKPPASDISWKELKALLEGLGYEMLTNSGSRRKFFHKGTGAIFSCHQPHPRPVVDKGCISSLVQHLKAYGFVEE